MGRVLLTARRGATLRLFKADLRRSIYERFGLSDVATSGHPFVTATVLPGPIDQGHYPDDFLTIAYDHVHVTRTHPATATTDITASSSSTDDDQQNDRGLL